MKKRSLILVKSLIAGGLMFTAEAQAQSIFAPAGGLSLDRINNVVNILNQDPSTFTTPGGPNPRGNSFNVAGIINPPSSYLGEMARRTQVGSALRMAQSEALTNPFANGTYNPAVSNAFFPFSTASASTTVGAMPADPFGMGTLATDLGLGASSGF